jgi:V/A-type H+-transporting ATPase subunit C
MNRFGYALGRVLVLESRIMTAARLDRLAHALTLPEQLKVLAETEYAPWLTHAEDRESVTESIERRVGAALELLEDSRAGDIARLFRVWRDFTNIKVALARDRGEAEPAFSGLGTTPVGSWEGGELPRWLQDELASAREVAAEQGAAEAAAHVDRRRLHARLKAARQLGDELAVELARLDVDMANARLVVRGASREDLMVGGAVKPADMVDRFAGDGLRGLADLVVGGLPNVGWPEADDAAPAPGVAGGLDRLEAVGARVQLALARQGRLHSTTSQPVVAWMAAVEAEARLVSLIVLGRMDGVSEAVVQDRVATVHG